jgi:DNA topoisomerase-1
MPNTLVIVESPAKCKKIESYLGPGYKVIASFGHLRSISGLDAIDIKNGFMTKYSIIQEPLKLKQIEKIRSEILISDDVIIATDDDREGEAIGWHICDLFGLSVSNTKRIIFHEITESAIQSAISHPKRINMNLVNAQQSRQILDLLVGFNITPILWNCISKTHDASLSAGRCQTPALRLVYDNYLDIKDSPGKIVYNTHGIFTSLNLNFELNKQFSNTDEIKAFFEQCKCWDFLCSSTSPKKIIKKSPEPLTTSSLQQLASNELNLSPKETMKYAQQLYEGGFITYMRTDSKKYSLEFIDNVKKYVINNHGEQYISPNIENLIVGNNSNKMEESNKKKSKKTVAEKKGIPPPQEAHEAIRPVNINIITPTLYDSLIQGKAIRLYMLIWKRTIESCLAAAQYNSISAKIQAPFESEFIYKTEQPIFLGWQIIESNEKKNSYDVKDVYSYISNLKQNLSFIPKKIESKFTMNELKSHYTEARLVQLLEENGIGRPSTFASLVDKIQERKYVLKQNITGKELILNDYVFADNLISEISCKREFGNEKNKLVIQPLGIIVIEFLINKFDTFFNYDYTKQMEDYLDLISKGDKEWISICNTCNDNLMDSINKLEDVKKFSIEIDEIHTLIIGKHGPVVKCIDPNNKKNVSFIPVKKNLDLSSLIANERPEISLEDVINLSIKNSEKGTIGKYRGQDLFIKKGKYGIYAQWGKETKSLKEEFSNISIEQIEYIDVIRFLDKDVLDSSKPIGLVRELKPYLSIRTGKFGDYIYYKQPYARKPEFKKPQFLKLNGFNDDYRKCDKELLINWIKQTYNIT